MSDKDSPLGLIDLDSPCLLLAIKGPIESLPPPDERVAAGTESHKIPDMVVAPEL